MLDNTESWSNMSKYEKLTFVYGMLAIASSLGLMWSSLRVLKAVGFDNLIMSLDWIVGVFLFLTILFLVITMWSKRKQD